MNEVLEAENRDLTSASVERQDTAQIKNLLGLRDPLRSGEPKTGKRFLTDLTMRHQNLMKRNAIHQKAGSISTAAHYLLKE